MNSKIATTGLLVGVLLLPMAGHGADRGQTDPGFISAQAWVGQEADRAQTDPGFISALAWVGQDADRAQTDPGDISAQSIPVQILAERPALRVARNVAQ